MNDGPPLVDRESTETSRLLRDLDKPSLANLAYALRHPETWPEGFHWNYGRCDSCAMGLAHELWKAIPNTYRQTGASVMARSFAMPFRDSERIFLEAWKERTFPRNLFLSHNIGPDEVADRIDAYLQRAE